MRHFIRPLAAGARTQISARGRVIRLIDGAPAVRINVRTLSGPREDDRYFTLGLGDLFRSPEPFDAVWIENPEANARNYALQIGDAEIESRPYEPLTYQYMMGLNSAASAMTPGHCRISLPSTAQVEVLVDWCEITYPSAAAAELVFLQSDAPHDASATLVPTPTWGGLTDPQAPGATARGRSFQAAWAAGDAIGWVYFTPTHQFQRFKFEPEPFRLQPDSYISWDGFTANRQLVVVFGYREAHREIYQ